MMSERRRSSAHALSTIGDALTKDLDLQTFGILHPRHIPLIKSPLAEDNLSQTTISGSYGPGSLKEATSNVEPAEERPPLNHKRSHIDSDPDDPPLRYEHESSTIQLFYDLFFVANLTTFSGKHEVTDGQTLKAFIGFFSLLWFTWFQVALFDIRFGNDSAFERVCKAIQFGVMVGLAVQSGSFTFEDFDDNRGVFRAVSFILMTSRFILALQYLASFWWLKKYPKAHIPILLHIVTLVITGFVCLGLTFAFDNDKIGIHATRGWWIIFPIEAIVILFVSGTTSFLNFRRTNIIERLGLLTLIILGEGIMNLGESVVKMKTNHDTFSSDTIGIIICSVLIVYFLYMLYFDQIETDKSRIGTLRSQIWTLGHFPFHVCILLVVEGFGQFNMWRRLVDWSNYTWNLFLGVQLPTENTTEAWENYTQVINTTLTGFWDLDFTETLDCIESHIPNGTYIQEFCNLEAAGTVAKYLAEDVYEIEVPEKYNLTDELGEGINFYENLLNLYSTVYLYFFVASGLTLVMLAILFILGKRSHSRIEWISIGIRFVVGITLAFLATMEINSDANGFIKYFWSAWMVPTVVLLYGLVIALDAIISGFSHYTVRRRTSISQDLPA